MKLFDVVLESISRGRSSVIPIVARQLGGIEWQEHLEHADSLLDDLPRVLLADVAEDDANQLARILATRGARAEVVPAGERRYCVRPDDPARGDQPVLHLERKDRSVSFSGPELREEETHASAEEAQHGFERQTERRQREGWLVLEEAHRIPAVVSAADEQLERRLAEHPDDLDSYLVYSDWLQQRGDARGELIALQHAASRAEPGSAAARELQRREEELFAAHRRHLLGQLSDEVFRRLVHLSWRNGFVDSVELLHELRHSGRYERPGLSEQNQLLSILFELPVARLLTGFSYRAHSPSDVVDVLIALGPPTTLRRLTLGPGGFDSRTGPSAGDVDRLLPSLPRLQVLELTDLYMSLESIGQLPDLRRLTLCGGVGDPVVDRICGAGLAQLERLSVAFRYSYEYPPPESFPPSEARLRRLLDGESLPALRHLGLRSTSDTDSLCSLLLGAPALPQLRSLDLSRGRLTDIGARMLIGSPRALDGLERLDLRGNSYGREVQQELVEVFGPRVVTGSLEAVA